MDEDIFKLVEKAILEVMDERTRPSRLNPEDRLVEDLKLGSLRTVDLVITLEDTLDLDISDDELPSLKTIRDVVDLITAKRGAGDAVNG